MHKKNYAFTRRDFLVFSGVASSSLVLGFKKSNANEIENLLDPGNPLMIPTNFEPTAYFTMEPSGKTTVHINKCEMGQHIGTALAQIVAEELELDWTNINIDYPGYPENISTLGYHFTASSRSVSAHFDELSSAGAAGRIALLETGAELLNANIEDCIANKSRIIDQWSGNSISYSDILSQTTIERKFDKEELNSIKLKSFKEYKLIGKSLKALDNFSKVNGKAKFGIDSYLPGMLYATVVTPPVRKGSKVVSFDDSECKQIKGFVGIVNPDFDVNDPLAGNLVVIANTFPEAMRAANVLKVNWNIPENKKISTKDLFEESKKLMKDKLKGSVSYHEGDVDSSLKNSEKMESLYTTSFVAHGLLEPYNTVIGKFGDTWHLFSGTQYNSFNGLIIGGTIAAILGVKPEEVKLKIHQRLAGGGFGSRFVNADRLALMASIKLNKPIKLIYTREAMMKDTEPRTASYNKLTAGISNGKLDSLHIQISAGSLVKRPELNFPKDWFVKDIEGKDGITSGAWTTEGAEHWYSIKNRKLTFYENKKLNSVVPVGALRQIGNGYVAFSLECFIDELAHKLNVDPLDFRLSLLNNNYNDISTPWLDIDNILLRGGQPTRRNRTEGGALRLKNVLLAVTGKAGYSLKKKGKNQGIGIAVAAQYARKSPSFNACVAEVEINPNNGKVKVNKLTYAIDCGTVINRDGAMAQIEGAGLFALSIALYEDLKFENGVFVQKNFDEYKMLRLKDTPEIEIELIETGGHPTGMGEVGGIATAPAIANAIFNAVGIRVKNLPINPDEIKEKLNAKLGDKSSEKNT
tara:strand:+ start:5002 stop:7422 length:2421 start_codon:yes stop_codon:yes gene_type:complete